MDNNTVEWTETLPPEVVTFLNTLYENYTEIVTDNPMDKPDFNGCIYMFAVYKMYIEEVEAGNITESEKLPLLEARKHYLDYSKRVHLTEILYL